MNEINQHWLPPPPPQRECVYTEVFTHPRFTIEWEVNEKGTGEGETKCAIHPQQTRYIALMLFLCWPSFADIKAALFQCLVFDDINPRIMTLTTFTLM